MSRPEIPNHPEVPSLAVTPPGTEEWVPRRAKTSQRRRRILLSNEDVDLFYLKNPRSQRRSGHKKTVMVTDLLTGEQIGVSPSDCGLGCVCDAVITTGPKSRVDSIKSGFGAPIVDVYYVDVRSYARNPHTYERPTYLCPVCAVGQRDYEMSDVGHGDQCNQCGKVFSYETKVWEVQG